MTPLYRRLRVCERFGINPAGWSDLPTDLRQMLEDYEAVREREEAREAASMAAARTA